jgi:hypothetical protein
MGTLIIIALLGLAAVLCYRAATVKKTIIPETTQKAAPDVNAAKVAERLSQAVQKVTVSHTDLSKIDWKPYREFIDLLAVNYPKVHRHAEREIVNDYSPIVPMLR